MTLAQNLIHYFPENESPYKDNLKMNISFMAGVSSGTLNPGENGNYIQLSSDIPQASKHVSTLDLTE